MFPFNAICICFSLNFNRTVDFLLLEYSANVILYFLFTYLAMVSSEQLNVSAHSKQFAPNFNIVSNKTGSIFIGFLPNFDISPLFRIVFY